MTHQYRITVNGTQGQVLDALPSQQWSHVADVLEARGGYATLERRLVTDKSFLDFQPDNVIALGEHVFTHWETFAELDL